MESTPHEPRQHTDEPYVEISQELAELAEQVFETHAEHPAEQVRAALEHQARDRGVELNDEQLERMSTEIAAGNRVEVGPV